ncbi:Ppx/GppA family phosphatase, partial [Streptomyces sp. SID625]|nr:Ppx/GppA family phosphatase [Streptomyces sp. SID625]
AQSLAGAVVGHTAMKLMGLKSLTLCPWAIREGVLLRQIEEGAAGASWWERMSRLGEEPAAPLDPVPLRLTAATVSRPPATTRG